MNMFIALLRDDSLKALWIFRQTVSIIAVLRQPTSSLFDSMLDHNTGRLGLTSSTSSKLTSQHTRAHTHTRFPYVRSQFLMQV